MSYNEKDLVRRMVGAIDNLGKEFTGLRTGRASVSMLDPVQVEVYGNKTPLNQVGTVNATESRLLTVQVWDSSIVASVEKAIRNSGLGLNPQTEGAVIRVPIPELNEERRQELVKVARTYSENTRISIRNIRRDGMDALKKMEKDSDISKDELKTMSDNVQKLTDSYIKIVDERLSGKEKDIMVV